MPDAVAPTIRAWQQLSCEAFVPVCCRTDEAHGFHASLRHVRISERVGVNRVKSGRLSVERVASAAERYNGSDLLFMVQLRSQSSVTQHGRTATLAPGSAVFYDPRAPYLLDFAARDQDLLVVQLDRRPLGVPDRSAAGIVARTIDADTPGLAALVGLAKGALRETAPPPSLAAAVESLVEATARRAEGASTASDTEVLRTEALAFVRKSYSSPDLNVAALARALHVSVRTLYSCFEKTGDTPAGWIRQERLQRAQELLRETTMSAAQISAACGYSDPSVFSRTFSRVTGLTPLAYRTHAMRA